MKTLNKPVQKQFDEALALHQAGHMRKAETIYREILDRNPNHHPTLHFYGVLAHQCNQNMIALEMLRKAIALEPNVPEYHNNCGAVYYATGKLEDAAKCYARAAELAPNFAAAQNNLGNALRDQGKVEEAEKRYKRAIDLDPKMTAAWNNLGNVAKDRGDFDAARSMYEKALKINPSYPEANNNLGNFEKDLGHYAEAEKFYRKAIEANPYFADAYNNLGVVMYSLKRSDEAMAFARKTIELKPDHADAHNNLGLALKDRGQYAEAIQLFLKAVQINPNYWQAFNNLGMTFHELGKLPEAIDCYGKVLELQPEKSYVYSNLLFTLNHHPGYTPELLFQEHVKWAQQYTKDHPVPKFKPRDPNRRLRIGYVSPDFRRHVVMINMEPILANHDRSKVEIFCYSFVKQPDEVTRSIEKLVDHWRDIAHWKDDDAAKAILEDEIDVLIDLTGHTGESRIKLFTRRIAPVQVSYLGYVNTTGLSTMDYRVTDSYGDPPGMTEKYYTEKIVRVPGSVIAYNLPQLDLPVAPAPALKNGYVTFGSFNNLSKVTPEVVELWARVLNAVPNARLLLKTLCLTDPEVQKFVIDMFAHHGIGRERLELVGFVSSYKDHLELYGKVDVGLDPFPFNGGITSFEALWMGVPIVTLIGNSFVSRLTVRQLACIGMTDWMADSKERYVQRAAEAAKDVAVLNALRPTIREKIKKSSLMDGKTLARDLEKLFLEMRISYKN